MSNLWLGNNHENAPQTFKQVAKPPQRSTPNAGPAPQSPSTPFWKHPLVLVGGIFVILSSGMTICVLALIFFIAIASGESTTDSYYSDQYASEQYYGSNGSFGAYAPDGYWQGESSIGGMPMTSGSTDYSGQGNDVFMVDGEVLTLPY